MMKILWKKQISTKMKIHKKECVKSKKVWHLKITILSL